MTRKSKIVPKLGAKGCLSKKAAKKTVASPDKAATQPLSDGNLPDANVGLAEFCIHPAVAEGDRPDTGEPCEDGRNGR